ncbi:AraC family transcriptional regulator [Sphingobacterium sp. SGR-19]|uniref:AraC family transcriptional regulator n=1 Tax=Sphingobacterium sp. SGR-19 TaxID=2710886 RepID=UPI0013ED9A5F|nr:helix-turn-helix domain-containing protein [Sphingobacterium sp. SGR-19]NGM66024.1 AraC family transcriptional regulator [Sphingobacterium sp. SGR-19]
MKKSLHINFRAHFGQPIADDKPNRPKPWLHIRYADTQYYAKEENWAIAQEFDGKHGYLFSYDLHLEETVTIPVQVDMGDLYVLYVVEGDNDILVQDVADDLVCTLAPGRARYLYVPPGDYRVELSAGGYQVFGFYFDGGIFRDGNDRSFRFLHEAIAAYRNKATHLVYSIDFLVGPKTLLHIDHLCNNLRKGDLDNEAFVLTELTRLMQLSKEKVFTEYEQTSDPELLIQRYRQLLAKDIAYEGNKAQIKLIATQLDIRYEYLNRIHKQFHGKNLRDYRNSLLVTHVETLLAGPFSLWEVAIQSGFHGPSELNRFFKKHRGMTLAQYRRSIEKV